MESKEARTNTFNQDGRILQVEYAIKNVSRAPTIIGLVCTDGVIILGHNKIASSTLEKIFKVDNNAYCGIAGVYSDALQLISYARYCSQDFLVNTGTEMPIKSLANAVGCLKQHRTLSGGIRPFGVSLLYIGFEDNFVLYSTDPGGCLLKWKAVCYGEKDDLINNKLKDVGEMDIEKGVCELVKIMKSEVDCTEKEAEKIEIFTMSKKGKRIYTVEEIRSLFIK